MTTLADLTTPMTVDEARATIYAALSARGVDTTLWIAGAPTRTVIAGLSIILAAFSLFQSTVAKLGFLSFAEKEWLTLVALYVYGVERIGKKQAAGQVTLTNAGMGVYTVAAGGLVVSKGDKTYRNTSGFSLGASPASVAVDVVADELGSGSSAGANTITNLVTPLPGVTCTNAVAFVGLDEEGDEALRSRCAAKLGTLSPNGARDAYDFVSKSATRTDGTPIGVTRTRAIADGLGGVDFYLADADGGLTDLGDIGRIDDLLQKQVVTLGVLLRTHGATTLAINYTYELWLPSTVTDDDATVQTKVEAAVAEFLGTRAIGGDVISPATGKVYKSALEDVIGGVYPKVKRLVTVPAGDTDVTSTQAPAAGSATCTAIHRVAGS